MEFKLKNKLIAQLEAIAQQEKVSLDALMNEVVENFIKEYKGEHNQPKNQTVKRLKNNNFVINFFANENIVELHTKFILSPHDLFWTVASSPSEEKINSELLNLIKEISLIPGIEGMHSVKKYSISVIKAEAFDLEEVLPYIEQKLIDYQK